MPKPPKINTLVTMYVNTRAPGLSQENIEDHVWMGDSNGDVDNNNAGRVKDYLTPTLSDGNVTWIPAVYNISTAPADYVLITNVEMTGDNEDKIKISKEPSDQYATHVNGKIKKINNSDSGLTLSYTIYFTVYRDGEQDLDLHIDPRIQINN